MPRPRVALFVVLMALSGCSSPAARQSGIDTGTPVLFEGASLISGDGSPLIDNSEILIVDGRIAAVGRKGSSAAPASARRVNLAGKFVMPALIDAHSHPGYTDVAQMSTSAAHYTRDNVIDHLRRYAYYGVAATLSLGLDRGDLPFDLDREHIAGAALFRTAGRGIAWPNAGPLAEYWRDAAFGVTNEAEARSAVRELAMRKIDTVKIWVDDRGGTVTKLPLPIARVIIDEAHGRGMRVIAHVYYLADAKDLLRAGIDGFAHGIRDMEVDEELIALFRTRPHVFLLPNLPDGPPDASEIEWLAETLPAAQIARMRQSSGSRTANAQRLYEIQLNSLRKLNAAGVRIGLGTDAGSSFDGTGFGWTAHTELADMVAGGLTPLQAIVAATRTSAEILGLERHGTIAVGKSADLLVLDGNPLDDIRNTRRIANVYLRGEAIRELKN